DGRQVVEPIVPRNIERRHSLALREAEYDRGRLGEEKAVMSRSFRAFHLIRQTEVQEFVGGIDDMCSPIAQGAHTKIIPATPLPIDVIVVVIVLFSNCRMPKIPVERIRDRLRRWKRFDIRIPSMPTARRIHMSGNCGDILDDPRIYPRLELEVVCL